MKTRLESYLHFIGSQGGTIHQIENISGVPASILLDGEISDETGQSASNGWWLHRTCSLEYRINKANEYHGDSDFWLSVARAGMI